MNNRVKDQVRCPCVHAQRDVHWCARVAPIRERTRVVLGVYSPCFLWKQGVQKTNILKGLRSIRMRSLVCEACVCEARHKSRVKHACTMASGDVYVWRVY
jgi:hypothetical protein